MKASDRIIVALDVPNLEAAIAQVDRLSEVSFWKVGLELFVSSGPAILQALRRRQKKIFLDLKFHDIPNTMAGACRVAGSYGVDLITVHATAGKAALQSAQAAAVAGAEAAGLAAPKLLGVSVLTSLSAQDLAFDLKVPLELSDYALQLSLLSQDSGLAGVVCSPQEAALLRRTLNLDQLIVCPGVRPTWAVSADQRRVLTPEFAIASGATYLVIGRPITAAEDPAAAWRRICDEIEN